MASSDAVGVTGEALRSLARSFTQQAGALEALVGPFRSDAVDGMAEAWGPIGARSREKYLPMAQDAADTVGAVVERLLAMARGLEDSAAAYEDADAGAAAMFTSGYGGAR